MRFSHRLGAVFTAVALACAAAGPAHAQRTPVYQSGPLSASGNLAKLFSNGLIGDAKSLLGDANGKGVNPFAVTDGKALGLCSNSAAVGVGYNALCIGHDASGNGLITLDSYAVANTALKFRLNGSPYDFPGNGQGNILGPGTVAVNDLAAWNNTAGTLLRRAGPFSAEKTNGEAQAWLLANYAASTIGANSNYFANSVTLTHADDPVGAAYNSGPRNALFTLATMNGSELEGVAIQAVCDIAASGATNTNSAVCFGANMVASSKAGMQNVTLIGMEIDLQAAPGNTFSTVNLSTGLSLNAYGTGVYDRAMIINSAAQPDAWWKDGIVFGNIQRTAMSVASGALMATMLDTGNPGDTYVPAYTDAAAIFRQGNVLRFKGGVGYTGDLNTNIATDDFWIKVDSLGNLALTLGAGRAFAIANHAQTITYFVIDPNAPQTITKVAADDDLRVQISTFAGGGVRLAATNDADNALRPLEIRSTLTDLHFAVDTNLLVGVKTDLADGVTLSSSNDAINANKSIQIIATALRFDATSISMNGTTGVTCAAGVTAGTVTVLNGIVTHC